VILVTKIGLMCVPPFTKVVYAPTISNKEASTAPKQIEGCAGLSETKPISFTKLITCAGDISCIKNAVTELMEFAKAFLRVSIPPYFPSEFLGVQSVIKLNLGSPFSNVTG
jgi:hypothetical protein